jgi:3-oxoacyl-[acyl-carrier protein] reductase
MSARLVADGFAVWALDTDEAEVTRTAKEIGATACALDVTDESAVDALAARLERCDALVNNAAIWRFTPLASTPMDEASRVLAVNVLGPLLLMQRLVPVMARDGGGTIVNVSSITAKYSPTQAGVYPASKAALEALTRVAAVEFGPLGIRCNAVGPGIIPTEGTLSHYGDEATRLRRGRALPAGRYGDPGDVADVVAFFCSDDSRYVTGQVIYVDGGYTAAGAHFFRLGRDAEARHAETRHAGSS